MPISTSDLTAQLKARAEAKGFDAVKITSAHLPAEMGQNLEAFVALGHHGTMAWLDETRARRASPDAMWPGAQSAIALAMNYHQKLDAFARLQQKSSGVISTYALNRDYHDVSKGKLKSLAAWFAKAASAEVKVFVDTAPVMEKPLAAQAGVGWQGKHTNLVSRELGSWFFLGVILTNADLQQDAPENNHCGSCQACLDICPTQAIVAAHKLDARRCISYLTIEHQGEIPVEFRKPMGNRIYGCDDCLAVCPWNKFAASAREVKFAARAELVEPSLASLLALDDAGFRKLFSGSPVKRIGHARLMRNCLIAAGNSGDATLTPVIENYIHNSDPVLREAAQWAMAELSA